ncbi:MAG: hypothetical protein M3340_03150 [Actinomycetota bacterium]|nr:hypothetical protein [Actinomycetota bacterium]
MDSNRFWRAAAIQGAIVAAVFVVLLLALDEDFFEDYGLVAGPLVWLGCSLISGRILGLPLVFALFCAAAGAVAGTLVGLVAGHIVGLVVGVAVFAASASGYDEEAGASGQASTP